MAGSLRQLTSRQLERLKSELAEVIIANFCYPAFLDYRLNMLRTRPVDRRKRQEVWAYVSGVNFSPIGSMDVGSMDFRRFVERVFLRYVDMNRALMATASARQVGAARARVPQLAMSVGRGLADYLVLSEASTFGQARLVESWGTTRSAQHEPAWEQIEKSTHVLQTTLVYLHTANAEKATLAAAGPDRAPTDEASFPDISSYPTKMLHPLEPDQRLASSGATNGASSTHSHPVGNGNGAHLGLEEVSLSPDLLEDDDAGVRGQFRGPRRSPTSSRPVDRPPALPPLMPAADVPRAPKDTTSRPIQPTFALPPAPAYEPPPAPQPTRAYEPPPAPPPTPVYQPPVASQPAAAPQLPVPASPAESSDDIWQELLMRGEAAPASAGPREKTPAALPVEKTPPTLPEQPDPDLLDLPESFSAPRLLELPPDLAELYGDYLRDSRAANLDLAAAAPELPPAEEQVQLAAAPLPTSETDEEVDALFAALTNQIAAKEQSERSAHLQQPLGPQAPEALFPPDEPVAPPQNGHQSVAQEASVAWHADVPQAAPPEAQRPTVGPAKELTDGDVMIFYQLQHQISTWVKMAAVSHQIDLAGRDAPALVLELRRMAALEEAELQVIESLVALCYRVTSTKQATMDDYKQAMMLYLLHHRSRLAL